MNAFVMSKSQKLFLMYDNKIMQMMTVLIIIMLIIQDDTIKQYYHCKS